MNPTLQVPMNSFWDYELDVRPWPAILAPLLAMPLLVFFGTAAVQAQELGLISQEERRKQELLSESWGQDLRVPGLIVSGLGIGAGFLLSAQGLSQVWQDAALGFGHERVQSGVGQFFSGILLSGLAALLFDFFVNVKSEPEGPSDS